MNGMELARAFWDAHRDGLFAGDLAPYAERAAAGLVGVGSECWGYDDETSRDHDWGPGCCIWLTRDDYEAVGAELSRRYAEAAARPFMGFQPRVPASASAAGRVGVFRVEAFYVRFLHEGMPRTLEEWRRADEVQLAAVTNGEVFQDGAGRFTEIRERLLAYYPNDLRLHRIANGCLIAAQAGQYNFPRQAARHEDLAALAALARFSDAAQQVVFALEKRYRPFYKWSARRMLELGDLGRSVHGHLDAALTMFRSGNAAAATQAVEHACERITAELLERGLSTCRDAWLAAQAEQVNAHVEDEALRCSNLMEL